MKAKILFSALILGIFAFTVNQSFAQTILGGLVGNDLTDLGDDGNEGAYAPPALAGFDAEFFASAEAGFGGGEFSFNVFDNVVGGGNAKSCCEGSPIIIGANFSNTLATGTDAIQLTRFTLTSSNDTPGRDPDVWSIEGSTDTTNGLDGTWTSIYDSTSSDWTARNQTISYSPAEGDTFLTSDGFKAFRLNVSSVDAGDTSAFALGEIEFFGNVVNPVPEPTSVAIWTLIGACLAGFGYRRFRRK